MLVKHVMTNTPTCCSPDTNLGAVAKLMLEHDCGEIPICDGTKIAGVVTDRDIACRGFLTGKNPLDVAVRDGRIKKDQHILLEAIGGGFTWGALLIRW